MKRQLCIILSKSYLLSCIEVQFNKFFKIKLTYKSRLSLFKVGFELIFKEIITIKYEVKRMVKCAVIFDVNKVSLFYCK